MTFPGKSLKTKEEEHYNKFFEWMKPLFLQIPLTDAIKLPPYSRYMKDIVLLIKEKFLMKQYLLCLLTTLLVARFLRSLVIQVYPPFLAPIKNNYVKTAFCDLGAGVSVMPFSLYKRLC